MSKLILFGVGIHTLKYITIIKYFGKNVDYLVDNSDEKVGNSFEGIEIISPYKLIDMECQIIISCIHVKEISEQLIEMGIGNKQISLLQFLSTNVQNKRVEKSVWKYNVRNRTICMDLCSGCKWGGAENWGMSVANAWAEKEKVVVIGDDIINISKVGEKCNDVKCMKGIEEIGDMILYLEQKLPLVFINNFSSSVFFVAIALKAMYPNSVTICNIVHNDFEPIYKLNMLCEDAVNNYICVSSKIRHKLINYYGMSRNKVNFIYQPIEIETEYTKVFNMNWPLNLGIASRIVKNQKRCDLVPQLIKKLEREQINYKLNIAGDGELFSLLEEFVISNNLSHKVKFWGYLDNNQMSDFWRKQDIYINCSEFEGASLSMLEAMSLCCVPIVTNVSGVIDYIENGVNGYIYEIEDTEGIAMRVKLLEKDRDKMVEMGIRARKEILLKCNLNKYVHRIQQMLK